MVDWMIGLPMLHGVTLTNNIGEDIYCVRHGSVVLPRGQRTYTTWQKILLESVVYFRSWYFTLTKYYLYGEP